VTRARFPLSTLRGDREIHRIHRSAREPWWFSDDGTGRFDPTGIGVGACYFAAHPLAAWIEVFRKTMLLAEDEVRGRSLYSVRLARDLRLADVTSRRALGFGITASVSTGENYARSQAFAAQAVADGFDGVRYLVRHDPAQRLFGHALFGEPGASHGLIASGGSASDEPIPDPLVEQARRVFGYRILPTP
jgi:hypothetical protein